MCKRVLFKLILELILKLILKLIPAILKRPETKKENVQTRNTTCIMESQSSRFEKKKKEHPTQTSIKHTNVYRNGSFNFVLVHFPSTRIVRTPTYAYKKTNPQPFLLLRFALGSPVSLNSAGELRE